MWRSKMSSKKNRRREHSRSRRKASVQEVVVSHEAEGVMDRLFERARSNNAGVLGVPGSATADHRAVFPFFLALQSFQDPDFWKGCGIFWRNLPDPANPEIVLATKLIGAGNGLPGYVFVDVRDNSGCQCDECVAAPSKAFEAEAA
jgi:hypothetical protein